MKLSVIITAFNHEKFVKESILSVVNQVTNFDYEIIIADDASSDNTAYVIDNICKEYTHIKFLKNKKNLGISRNYAQCLRVAQGQYIADVAGDDIWTDDYKLQKEVDFLDENPQYGMVHTQYDIKIENSGKIIKNVVKDAVFGSNVYERLLIHNTICSITTCYKKELIIALIDKFESGFFAYEDTPMWLEISNKAGVGYINDSTATYRVLNESASHSDSYEKKKNYLQNVNKIVHYFLNEYPVSDAVRAKVMQQEYIKNCCLEFIGENKSLFKENYKKLDYIPKRIRLVNILFKHQFLLQVFRPIKFYICPRY